MFYQQQQLVCRQSRQGVDAPLVGAETGLKKVHKNGLNARAHQIIDLKCD